MTAVLIGQHQRLRELPNPEAVDPVPYFLGRDNDTMERALYANGRDCLEGGGRVDGFRLYSAPLREGLGRAAVRKAYAAERVLPGFSEADFANRHYDLSQGALPIVAAPQGMSIDSFINHILKPMQIRDLRGFNDDGPHLHLPFPAYAPGGRFVGPFPHDDMYAAMDPNRIFNVLDNQAYQIARYGYPFNFTSIASAGRTQTPFFSYVVERAVSNNQNGAEILQHYLPAMERYFNFFERDQQYVNEHNREYRRALYINGFRLARHYDDMPVDFEQKIGGRRESQWEDNESAARAIQGIEDSAERQYRWERHMISTGAIAESCYDFSLLRWSRDQKSLHDLYILEIAPLELNANLVHMANMIATAYEARGDDESMARAITYRLNAQARAHALHTLGYNPATGAWHDIHKSGRRTPAVTAAMGAILHAGGIGTPQERLRTLQLMHKKLLKPYGLQTSEEFTGQQWDGMVWAGPAYQAGEGAMLTAYDLQAAGQDPTEAVKIGAEIFGRTADGIWERFAAQRKLPERFLGTAPRRPIKAGEYDEAENLAMTGDVYQEMDSRNLETEVRFPEASPRKLSIAPFAGSASMAGMYS